MKYHIITYGCQMNKSDSERIAAVLESAGYRPAKSEKQADLIVVVACSVRQSAVDRIYGKARTFAKLKIKNEKLKTVLTGCVIEEDKKKLKNQFDYVLSIDDWLKFPISNFQFLNKSQIPNPKIQNNKYKIQDLSYFHIQPHYTEKFRAYVPIMTGCNNFCSYCVVPYVRGREVSRDAADVLAEVKELVKNGCLEITLLGQNVNAYRPVDIESFSKSNPYVIAMSKATNQSHCFTGLPRPATLRSRLKAVSLLAMTKERGIATSRYAPLAAKGYFTPCNDKRRQRDCFVAPPEAGLLAMTIKKECHCEGKQSNSNLKMVIASAEGAKQSHKQWDCHARSVASLGMTIKSPFAALLWEINQIPGVERIHFTAPHPRDMSDEVIRTLTLPKMVNYLHLPVQAGDNTVLRRMNRHYTAGDYLKLVEKIRKEKPGIALGTDIIVGFPGETKKAFQNTVKLYKKADFDIAYLAMYSPREGTAAAKLEDNVSWTEKKRRWQVLQNLMEKITLKKNQKYVGKVVSVLVDEYKNGQCFGNSREMKRVRFVGKKDMVGKIFNVKVKKAFEWILEGDLVFPLKIKGD